jgi:hypothetical protein
MDPGKGAFVGELGANPAPSGTLVPSGHHHERRPDRRACFQPAAPTVFPKTDSEIPEGFGYAPRFGLATTRCQRALRGPRQLGLFIGRPGKRHYGVVNKSHRFHKNVTVWIRSNCRTSPPQAYPPGRSGAQRIQYENGFSLPISVKSVRRHPNSLPHSRVRSLFF